MADLNKGSGIGLPGQAPARMEQVQEIEHLQLQRERTGTHAWKRLAKREVEVVNPWSATTVPRHDPASLPVQTRCSSDQRLQSRLLPHDCIGIPVEPNLGGVADIPWDIDGIVCAGAIAVEITSLSMLRRQRIGHAGSPDVYNGKGRRPSGPRRPEGSRDHDSMRLIEVRYAECCAVHPAGHRT